MNKVATILNSEKRRRIVAKINRIENYDSVLEIGKILAKDHTVKTDKSSYTINNNGFHIRISKLSDDTINKIDHYLLHDHKKLMDKNSTDTDVQKGSIFNNLSETSVDESNVRLSSKEKKFFKKNANCLNF